MTDIAIFYAIMVGATILLVAKAAKKGESGWRVLAIAAFWPVSFLVVAVRALFAGATDALGELDWSWPK